MHRLTGEMNELVKRPFYRRFSGEIFTSFLVLHNLSRVLLDDCSGNFLTLQKLDLF